MIKKLVSFCIVILIAQISLGQCPTGNIVLTSQAEVDAFAADFPDCTIINGDLFIGVSDNSGTDITNIAALSQIQGMSGEFRLVVQDNPNLTSISELSGISQIRGLFVSRCDNLTSLNGLENISSITQNLSITNNLQLSDISALQNIELGDTVDDVIVFFNDNPQVTSLENMFAPNSTVRDLQIWDMDGLTSLAGLENITSVIRRLVVANNPGILNLNPLDSIEGEVFLLEVVNNDALVSLSGLSGITGIRSEGSGGSNLFIGGNASLLSLDGLENLRSTLTGTDEERYEISSNTLLEDISALEQMNFKDISSLNLLLVVNPNLSYCNVTSICELLENPDNATISIQGNDLYCTSIADLINECELNSNVIGGEVKFDFDNNGCATSNINIPAVLVETTDGITTVGSFTNSNGVYQSIFDFDGVLTTTIIQNSLPTDFTATPTDVQTAFVGFGNEADIDFCAVGSEPLDDLKVTLLPLSQAAPGFNSNYRLIYENRGVVAQSSALTFTFDSTRQNFVDSNPAPTSIIDNVVTWSFTNLLPFESREIDVTLNHLPPPLNNNNDEVVFEANIEDEGDESPVDNLSILEQILLDNVAPIDMRVGQGDEIFEDEVNGYLNFIVRFQNTGSEKAIKIRIENLLTDVLDWSTLRPLSASHDFRTQILNGNELSFYFDNIDLPPMQTDEEASKGYVAFQIKPLASIQLGDVIESQASIFFDLNAPISTNSTTTTVVQTLGLSDIEKAAHIKLLPNPVSNTLHIILKEGIEIESITFYSLTGKKVIITNNTIISTEHLLSGVYFVILETNFGPFVSKVIKK